MFSILLIEDVHIQKNRLRIQTRTSVPDSCFNVDLGYSFAVTRIKNQGYETKFVLSSRSNNHPFTRSGFYPKEGLTKTSFWI